MKRITQSLFEEIQKVTSNQIEEKKKIDQDKDGDHDFADVAMARRKASGQSHAQAHAATRKHNEEVEIAGLLTQEEFDTLSEEDQEMYLEHLELLDELSKGMQRLARKVIPGHGKKVAGERAKDQGYSAALDREALKYHPDDKKLQTSQKSSLSAQQRYKKIARGESSFGVKEEVELEEGISETIIKHNDFALEITANPTFADFLNAAKSFVDSEEDAIAVAESFYNEQDDSIIIEAFTRADIDAKVAAHQKAGHTVSMPKFSTKGGEPHAEYVVSDKETKVRRKYIHHGTARRVENMGTPGKKDKGEK